MSVQDGHPESHADPDVTRAYGRWMLGLWRSAIAGLAVAGIVGGIKLVGLTERLVEADVKLVEVDRQTELRLDRLDERVRYLERRPAGRP